MAENTRIEWCDHTFNPWIGCTKISPACDHCYAAAWDRRFAVSGHAMHWGAGKARMRTSAANWRLPLKWNRQAERTGTRPRVFCASLADVFDNEVDPQWRRDLFSVIDATPNLDWLLLTKRIGNAHKMAMASMWPLPFPRNVWLGATVVNQAEAARDIPKLLAVPAVKRFLSIEPMLGPINVPFLRSLPCYCHKNGMHPSLDWVIVGGESGPGARPMHPDWARSVRDQCQAAGVRFLFKQWGDWAPMGDAGIVSEGPRTTKTGDVIDWMRRSVAFEDGKTAVVEAHTWTGHGTDLQYRVGKKAAGRLLDGRIWDGVPS